MLPSWGVRLGRVLRPYERRHLRRQTPGRMQTQEKSRRTRGLALRYRLANYAIVVANAEGAVRLGRRMPTEGKANPRAQTGVSVPRRAAGYFLGDFRRASSKSMYCWRAWGSAPRRRRPLTKRVGVLRTSRSLPLARLASTSAAAWGLLRQDLK